MRRHATSGSGRLRAGRLLFAPLVVVLAHCAGIVGISDVPGGSDDDDGGLGIEPGVDGDTPRVDGGSSRFDVFIPGHDGARPGVDADEGDDGGGPGVDSGGSSSDGGALGYRGSNLGLLTFDPKVTGPLNMVGDNCRIYTDWPDPPGVSCYSGQNPPGDVFAIDLPGGAGKAVIYVFTYINIDDESALQVTGTYPLILVALDSVDIAGSIDASADVFDENVPVIPGERVKGPGVGGFNNGGPQGGGGGSFCGVGGTGAMGTDAKAGESSPGTSYGTANLIPLWGGSAGGGANTGDADEANGNGGGAVQISAASKITIEPTGYVTVNGSGGVAGGDESGEGGGSGGAILLEAPIVEVKGILEANGGEGSDPNSDGADAPNDGGVPEEPSNAGGKGAWGNVVTGANGSPTAGSGGEGAGYGGGGGGAGWIRVNATHATLTGTISPRVGTTCMSQGPLP